MVAHHSLICRVERSAAQTRRLIIIVFSLFLFGCSFASPSPNLAPASETAPPPATPTAKPDFADKLRNAEYQLGATDVPRTVQLTDGEFQQGAPGDANYVIVNVTDFMAKGSGDYAMLVSENYGGSGAFVFLAYYTDVNGKPGFIASRLLDDRPQLSVLSIQDHEIFVAAIVHGSQDPLCCPTLRTARHYHLDKTSQLVMDDYVTFTPEGKPRTIAVDAPANGSEVFGSVPIRGSVAVAPFENTLAYRIFSAGNVELAAGAIPVTASAPGEPGAFNTIIALGNILSGAVVRLEVQDLSAEDGSLLAMDSVELVVK
jgi:hypothetical protein